MNNYDVVIGIEIHLELLTKSKMFSPAPVVFGEKPNIAIDEIVLGYPGAMPQVNKKAVELALQACHLLNLKINDKLQFDRKHYYYHDLPKGFQITQNEFPIGSRGFLEIKNKTITIQRAHLEEDTAKTKKNKGNLLIDYNRCGNPLLEIVTGPDFTNAAEVAEYVKIIRMLTFYSKISNAKMEEGSFRCDVNISLKPKASKKLGNKVEIKNINSIGNIITAINFEIDRQSKMLDENKTIPIETRKFDEKSQQTISMRSKEKAIDYRYIRESNIAPIHLNEKFIKETIKAIPINALALKKKFLSQGMSAKKAEEILSQFNLIEYIIEFDKYNKNMDMYFKVLLNDFASLLKNANSNNLTPKKYSKLISAIVEGNISNSVYKKALKDLIQFDIEVTKALENNKIDFINDPGVLLEIINKNINDDTHELYKKRPEKVMKMIMGQVMKETKGKADPKVATDLIEKILNK